MGNDIQIKREEKKLKSNIEQIIRACDYIDSAFKFQAYSGYAHSDNKPQHEESTKTK